MARYVVATTAEIPPGGRRSSRSPAGRSAFSTSAASSSRCATAARTRAARCARAACRGWSRPGRPARTYYSRAGEILRCPWHGWEFDLRTGQSWFDPRASACAATTVSVEAGSSDPARGPYIAETYPVAIEAQMLVIEIGP